MSEQDWTLLPAVTVRSAGFAWELVRSLAYPRAAAAAAEVVRLERRALDLLAEAPARRTEDPRPVRSAAGGDARPARGDARPPGGDRLARGTGGGRLPRGLRSRLRDLRPLPGDTPAPAGWLAAWNEVTGSLEDARLALAGTTAADAALARAAVAGIAADERFLDALVRSAPGLYRDLRRGAAKGGRLRRLVGSVLQGLCATCSFGPLDHGRVEPAAACGHTWSGHRVHPRRVAYPADWVGESLQQRVLADPALVAGLVPRRRTWTGAVPDAVPDAAPFLALCDGSRTLAEIAAESGTALEQAAAALAVAVRRGLLTHDLCPPATAADPLSRLRERLPAETPHQDSAHPDTHRPDAHRPGAARPDAARSDAHRSDAPRSDAHRPGGDLPVGRRVREITELLAQYPAASPDVKLALQRRIETLAGGGRAHDDRPGDDRVAVHEAAAGTLRVTVGAGLAADLEGRVPQVLDLLAADAELTRRRTNRLLAARLGTGTFGLAEVLGATGDLEIRYGDRLAERIAAIVRAAPPGAATVDLAGLLDDPEPPAAPVLCSADVMVAAPSLEAYEPGLTPLVLGDLHDVALLTPWALQFHPDGAALVAERDAAIERALGGHTALNVISRRATGRPPLEFPGPVLELGGVTADGGRRRIGLDELYVHSDGRRAVLRAKGVDGPLLLHNGEHDDTALHTALALPRVRRPDLRHLSRVPRLTWDNVVISRRAWRVGRASFDALGQAAGDRELLVAMARLRETHDLPVTFFAASARERRPIHVDTRSPALVEGLARLAATAERLTLTETLPGPEECWLRDGGLRFAAELRCVYLRPAGGRPAPRPAPDTTDTCSPAPRPTPDAADTCSPAPWPTSEAADICSPAARSRAVARYPGPADVRADSCSRVAGPVAPGARAAHPYPWQGERR
ncbi:lantibiotic dehydratase [Nonomuraea jabiensis]|uniref:Lantibiotic dehydratase N-terminal domain-containing protein n=1 Tax=Nonomuraea jabiensis TaxID=882448 RepID=A0A7W9GHG5_9ACTN|nr:lantibiotic dehydratase [Nonomuraea jabiensis]MBB5783904.1 hypothetical protein [Nonomuraea jabiensis]